MKARLVLAAAVMIMLAGPALAQSKEAIQKLNDEWAAAFNKGDAGAVAALYTADAYVLPPGAPMVMIGGAPAARVGDMCVCVGPPDVIVLGSTTVLVGGQPAARMGDLTSHGGTVVMGVPNVMIG